MTTQRGKTAQGPGHTETNQNAEGKAKPGDGGNRKDTHRTSRWRGAGGGPDPLVSEACWLHGALRLQCASMCSPNAV